MAQITILGAGVSGLTTGILLREAGYQVRILARELPAQTVSAVAAAIWFPYEAEPAEMANRWSAASYLVFQELAGLPGTGVSMVDFLVLSAEGQDDSWKEGLPKGAVRQASAEELPPGFNLGYLARVPLAETPVYLPYLQARFLRSGGELAIREVLEVDSLLQQGHAVVNCTGLGARQLFSDDSLYPIRGQVLRAAKKEGVRSMVFSGVKGQLAYIIVRSTDIVLGGTDYSHDYRLEHSEEDTRLILQRCRALDAAIDTPTVLGAAVGLRPKRPAIRCEREAGRNVIHNYGHGGAGYTVSWGCAQEVLHLMQARR